MSWLTRTLTSTSGRKMLAAVTGILLVLFLIIHLIGNLQIFDPTPGPANAFNAYAKALHDGPLIIIGDVGLLIMFPLHIAMVIWLAVDNRKARGETRYKVTGTKQDRPLLRILASKTTVAGGLLLLAFIAFHVWHFRLQHEEIGVLVREHVVSELLKPHIAIIYILGSLLTGWHVFHGAQAAFRSLGFHHNRYTPFIEKAGMGLAIVLALGFVSIPVWILLA